MFLDNPGLCIYTGITRGSPLGLDAQMSMIG